MLLHMQQVCVLGVILFLLCHVKQKIEPAKILVALDHGSDLLILQHRQFLGGLAERLQEPLPFGTKSDFRYRWRCHCFKFVAQFKESA